MNTIDINIDDRFDIINQEELIGISGGEVVVTQSDAAGIGDRAGQFWDNVSSSVSSFWSGFTSGYERYRKQ